MKRSCRNAESKSRHSIRSRAKSPDRNLWWHFGDTEERAGGTIEVKSQGDQNWTLSPVGNLYTSAQDEVYVANGVGYELQTQETKVLEGQTFRARLQEMGLPAEVIDSCDDQHQYGDPRAPKFPIHEARVSRLGPSFRRALEEM